ncbi:MAG: riboflavin biosynthesis protein RibF [Candidatus Kapabacteria bacterium]|nr:riboflavin biosynthesis protein RibF [Ignavibacteriota bacterium]MCW5884412.1 riboflavin biosynthesis protein RibF [Candidatus Kapabacteria bacterium]
MNIFRSFDEINFQKDTILTVGTFDGIHLGHQFIINKLLKISEDNHLRNLILTIHPHPQIVLKKTGKSSVSLLTSIEERLELFKKFRVQNVLIIPFTYEFSQITAREFVVDYLIEKVGMKRILIGYDHLFGKDRNGNENLLKELSPIHNFEIERLERIGEADHSISSSAIRKALLNSDLITANKFLGHHYGLRGEVIHGLKRGRTIGFPTANLLPDDEHKLLPPVGVYFVYSIIHGRKYYGMANIGYKPTVTSNRILTIEANFFDFNLDIYGETITLHFVKKIRDEKKFSGIDELKNQIKLDKNTCLELIS